jgi:hypothetical protein
LKVIVWLDSGRTLAQSPPGPWSDLNGGPYRHYFHPVCMYKPGIGLKAHRVVDQSGDLNLEPLEQSIRLLPRFYGKSLKTEEMFCDPFYALNEVFAFVISSELLFLRTISSDLDMDFEDAEEKLSHRCCVLTLMHYQRLLERQGHRTEETLNFINNRHTLDWPRLEQPSSRAINAEAKLKLDFKYLLREGRRLKKRCGTRIAHHNIHSGKAPSKEPKKISSNHYTWRPFIVGGISIVLIANLSLRIYGLQECLRSS